MVTVEADQDLVESRLAGGGVRCPACPGSSSLRPWGWARARPVAGLAGRVRPRRGRCSGCGATHVLLPVTLLVRRGYAASLVWSALVRRGRGLGHRRVAAAVGVPVTTVRDWLRRMGGRLGPARSHFTRVALMVGIDVRVPESLGCPWRDFLAAVGLATAAVGSRFGRVGYAGVVTAVGVVVALSGGRLLAPGWPPGWAQHEPALMGGG